MNRSRVVIKRRRASASPFVITPQEIAAINAVALHGAIPRAAEALGLAAATVDTHLDRMRDATGLRSTFQLVAWAAVNGYLSVTAEELERQALERAAKLAESGD